MGHVRTPASLTVAPAPFTFRMPAPRLADHVRAYLGHDRSPTGPILRRIPAPGSILVGVDLVRPVRRALAGEPAPAAVSPVSGLGDRPLVYEQTGVEKGILVELTPRGAYALFGCPLREIAGVSVGLGELLGDRARRLADELAGVPTWEARFQLLDVRLAAWLRDGPDLPKPLQGAWQLLDASAGRIPIATLADRVGWSRQYLAARFRHQLGVPPKVVARVARLHHAIQWMTAPRPPRWPDVAASCGYADQPHLNLDFRALAGCAPTELLDPAAAIGEVFLGIRPSVQLIAARQRRLTHAGGRSSGRR
ncbi:helix-turn-helix domain-containing protein [Amycolatopsis sp. MtRt-6]|uniref:AraC family transcriptional regulator n=1 Tax=Amycolatopsis sp. MtRt-6 TaxID=2792782 RepID=UPI001A8DD2FA|nr:helix-turn-helix domain-containing protein [Amycolatopsis sp. MtRt-6]